MKILVKGRDTLRELVSEQPAAIVSISDDPKDFPDIPGCTCFAVVLRQHFHDIEIRFGSSMVDMFDSKKNVLQAFTEGQAIEVAKFVLSLPNEVKTLVLQCEAGISRSAGMAAAVARYLGHDDMPFFRDYLPNRLVYRLTLEALRAADYWRCTNCGCVEWNQLKMTRCSIGADLEMKCQSCDEGEMVYRAHGGGWLGTTWPENSS